MEPSIAGSAGFLHLGTGVRAVAVDVTGTDKVVVGKTENEEDAPRSEAIGSNQWCAKGSYKHGYRPLVSRSQEISGNSEWNK